MTCCHGDAFLVVMEMHFLFLYSPGTILLVAMYVLYVFSLSTVRRVRNSVEFCTVYSTCM